RLGLGISESLVLRAWSFVRPGSLVPWSVLGPWSLIDSRDRLLALERFQRGEPPIVPLAAAGARAAIQVRATDRTQTKASFAAQGLHRHRQIKLLPHELSEIDLLVLVKRSPEILVLDFQLAFPGVFRVRPVLEIELRVHRHRIVFQTPAARQIER